MADARDISKLFAQLGGSDVGYLELDKDSRASSAADRWPLLRSVNIGQAKTAPPAAQGDAGSPSPGRSRPTRVAETQDSPSRQAPRQSTPPAPRRDSAPASGDGLSGLFARLADGAGSGEAPAGRAPSLWSKKVS